MARPGHKQPASGFDLYSIPSAWKGHERFAQWLVQQMRPQIIVELGCDCGFSTIAFAQPGLSTVYGIDRFLPPERNAFEPCRANIAASGVTNIELIKADFRILAGSWSLPIDLLHIDGNGQHWNIGGIDADRSSQNSRLPHQVWRDLTLNSHNRLHSSVRIIQDTGGRVSERAD
jgi:hypothetical protein